jgi:hypothetical protein
VDTAANGAIALARLGERSTTVRATCACQARQAGLYRELGRTGLRRFVFLTGDA